MIIDERRGPRVLVAEDDVGVQETLEAALCFEGYQVTSAADGAEALRSLTEAEHDLMLLDIGMPRVDGITVCRLARDRGLRTPILMLTARQEVADRVAGLDAGADDYLAKPFALDELLARTRALLRRADPAGDGCVEVAGLLLDADSRTIRRGDRRLELTKTEFDLLELLMRNAGIVLSRETLYDRIWGFDFGTNSKSLDVYVGYLRRKTEEAGEPRVIQTVRGVGYVFRESGS
ncbi:MAG: response regulator transcription factor [Acidimicrobiales bacterium]|nr:response regulator transcription factor [Acidimicrobiales bacterium]